MENLVNGQFKEMMELRAKAQEYNKTHTIEYIVLTPELAEKFLAKNLNTETERNRTVNQKTLNKLATDSENGDWIPEANQGIQIDTNGRMINGQHTCRSVIKTGISVIVKMETGCSPDTFKALDSGKARTHTDALTTLKLPDGTLVEKPKTVASAINILYNLQKKNKHIDKDYTLSNSQICDMLIQDWKYYTLPIEKITKWYINIHKRISDSWLLAFYYAKKRAYCVETEQFMNILCNCDTLSPLIRDFREQLAENKSRGNGDKKKMSPYVIFQKMEILFQYHLDGDLSTRRNFKKNDLDKIVF